MHKNLGIYFYVNLHKIVDFQETLLYNIYISIWLKVVLYVILSVK